MTPNTHGKWLIAGTPEHRADLEERIGSRLAEDDDRVTRKSGPPDPGIPQCSYCGSITPEDFVRFCQQGVSMEVADLKYGWPHKVYLDIPNPKPDEQRGCGTTYHGDEKVEVMGTYPKLHLKFYTTHLGQYPELAQHAELIRACTGFWFEVRDGKLMWKRQKSPTPADVGPSAGLPA